MPYFPVTHERIVAIMLNYLLYLLAAVFEIAGCYAFWAWLRLGKGVLWIIPGTISLVLFALLLTRIESQYAGRAYAAYGGIYIISSLAWMVLVERTNPLVTDYLGVILCLGGSAVILFGPRLISG